MPLHDASEYSGRRISGKLILPDLADLNEAHDLLYDLDALVSGDQLMVMQVGDEYYGVDIGAVTEIRRYSKCSRLPNASAHVLGVINMRGEIVPLLDLRIFLGIGQVDYLNTTVVVVLSGEIHGTGRTMGFVVDAVTDVVARLAQDEQPVSTPCQAKLADLYTGFINRPDYIITCLNVQRLLSLEA